MASCRVTNAHIVLNIVHILNFSWYWIPLNIYLRSSRLNDFLLVDRPIYETLNSETSAWRLKTAQVWHCAKSTERLLVTVSGLCGNHGAVTYVLCYLGLKFVARRLILNWFETLSPISFLNVIIISPYIYAYVVSQQGSVYTFHRVGYPSVPLSVSVNHHLYCKMQTFYSVSIDHLLSHVFVL